MKACRSSSSSWELCWSRSVLHENCSGWEHHSFPYASHVTGSRHMFILNWIQSHASWDNVRWILVWFISLSAVCSSSLTSTKFVPWSHWICRTGPRRPAKRRYAFRKESVESEWVTSIWIARVTRHVNKQPHLFLSLNSFSHMERTKHVHTAVGKGGGTGLGSHRSVSRCAIFCPAAAPLSFLQVTHFQM